MRLEFLSMFIDKYGSGNFALTHVEESKKIVTLLSVAVFWNEEVTENEIEESYKTIREYFSNLGVESDEIELIKKQFIQKIYEYQENRMVFVEDKKNFLSSLTDDDSKDDLITMMEKVFESDGIDDCEKEALDQLKK